MYVRGISAQIGGMQQWPAGIVRRNTGSCNNTRLSTPCASHIPCPVDDDDDDDTDVKLGLASGMPCPCLRLGWMVACLVGVLLCICVSTYLLLPALNLNEWLEALVFVLLAFRLNTVLVSLNLWYSFIYRVCLSGRFWD